MAALGATCRALRAACADGEVWRALLRRRFPASVLHASSLADWRIAYAMEANCVLPGAWAALLVFLSPVRVQTNQRTC